MNTVEMEQQQPVYVEQPQTVHETAAMADPSETSALLLLIFGTIICPICAASMRVCTVSISPLTPITKPHLVSVL